MEPEQQIAETSSTPKPKNKLALPLILVSVLAAAGIGFGVYEYIDSGNKSVKISELSAKLDLVKTETNTELVTKNEDGVERTYVEPVETSTRNEDPATAEGIDEYIYLSEWGIKIKKPEYASQDGQIAHIDYAFDGSRLFVWGTMYRTGDQAAMGGGLIWNKGKIGSHYLIEIEQSFNRCLEGEEFGELSGKKMCYIETSESSLLEEYSESTISNRIMPTIKILKETFANLDNYSAI